LRAFLPLLLFASLPLLAGTGTITGRVTDASGGVLPGVTVEVQSRVITTRSDGWYRIDRLEPGQYDVSFKLLNFATSWKKASVIADQQTQVDARLVLSSSAEIVVTGKRTFSNLAELNQPINGLLGIADAATVGVITAQQIEHRPVERAGEILETVPGVIVSQHSGEGKANQYYLRGFDLDHGTDMAITVAGVPVNMPTHAHGQGYSDTNFLIPELISGVQFRKGPYYADEGDFTTAGAVNINYTNTLDHPLASATGGDLGFARALYAESRGSLLYAVEMFHNDGPWRRPDDYRRGNAIIRYSEGNERSGFSITAMLYSGRWNSTDQIPDRAVRAGLISRFDAIDPTDGGKSHRYSASIDWQSTGENTLTKADAYVVGYGLNLFSNFTYYLADPVNGDQFEQVDRRVVSGLRGSRQWLVNWGRFSGENVAGIDVRNDNIATVGLFHTRARQRLETIRDNSVVQTSASAYVQNSMQWTSWLRTVVGVRDDHYRFHVQGDVSHQPSIVSPKASIVAGPWSNSEFYANLGYGFHSNDARGATPLVRAKGGELGFRSRTIPRLMTTISLWGLNLDSELVFAGDAGTTEASNPSRRRGVEWSTLYNVTDRIVVDGDYVFARSRFTNGDHIPGSPERVIAGGVTFAPAGPVYVTLRYRYFGPRPLTEDNSARSRTSDTISARLGYEFVRGYRIEADVFNVLDRKVSDIDYFYTSRLPGEPAEGVNDVHSHPIEPRSFRVGIAKSF